MSHISPSNMDSVNRLVPLSAWIKNNPVKTYYVVLAVIFDLALGGIFLNQTLNHGPSIKDIYSSIVASPENMIEAAVGSALFLGAIPLLIHYQQRGKNTIVLDSSKGPPDFIFQGTPHYQIKFTEKETRIDNKSVGGPDYIWEEPANPNDLPPRTGTDITWSAHSGGYCSDDD